MKSFFSIFLSFLFVTAAFAQKDLPTDYLSKEFHKERRETLRSKLPNNSVALFFANPVRNRANDVEYIYHQDPDFYYLTGYKEPHAVLVIFSEDYTDAKGKTYNETLFVQEKNARMELWTGMRLGTKGAQEKLGFKTTENGKEFLDSGIDFMAFDAVLFKEFFDDYRDHKRNTADLFKLIKSFKQQIGYNISETVASNDMQRELNQSGTLQQRAKIDTKSILTMMAEMRQIKTPQELELLTKAVRISAQGQIEVMKAKKPNMSETEIQGIHEYVYKKYGSEYEGYPSIVGAGSNGCVLHYIENSKTTVEGDLVLMDLGAEYHGYTADVTRTIPSSGTFTPEQKAIYDIVYASQEAGIKACTVGTNFWIPNQKAVEVVNRGLAKLGIIASENEKHNYLPHGTSHHIGLDVHDPGTYGAFEANMVITVEPGIYIPEGSPCDKKWWGIAVRIEDDILITDNGPVNLSAEAPRKSEEIEKMMKLPSPLDSFKLPKID
jgi:Xaa-Pro aminopeptidase